MREKGAGCFSALGLQHGYNVLFIRAPAGVRVRVGVGCGVLSMSLCVFVRLGVCNNTRGLKTDQPRQALAEH